MYADDSNVINEKNGEKDAFKERFKVFSKKQPTDNASLLVLDFNEDSLPEVSEISRIIAYRLPWLL